MNEAVRAALVAVLHAGEQIVQGANLALAGDQQAADMLIEDWKDRGQASSRLGRLIRDLDQAMWDQTCERIAAEEEAQRACMGERG